MRFITKSGSTYEVNETDKQVRRLNGENDPTPRQGKDGEWKPYDTILSGIEIGRSVMIVWTSDIQPPPVEGSLPTTITSPVIKIVEG
jgi:hypothetical protein